MQTILNRVEKFKSFVYGRALLEKQDGELTLVVEIEPGASRCLTLYASVSRFLP
jgi:hypothetical protein